MSVSLSRRLRAHADALVQLSVGAPEPAKHLLRIGAGQMYQAVDEIAAAEESAWRPKGRGRLRYQGWARRRLWRWWRGLGKA